MPKFRFSETREVQDSARTIYEAGVVYDLPQTSCERWKKRGAGDYAGATSKVSEPNTRSLTGDIFEPKSAEPADLTPARDRGLETVMTSSDFPQGEQQQNPPTLDPNGNPPNSGAPPEQQPGAGSETAGQQQGGGEQAGETGNFQPEGEAGEQSGGGESSDANGEDGDADGDQDGDEVEVEIPADWKSLHHSTKRALARRILPDEPIETAVEAEQVIETELARRAEG